MRKSHPYPAGMLKMRVVLGPSAVVADLAVAGVALLIRPAEEKVPFLAARVIVSSLPLGGTTVDNAHSVSSPWHDEHPKRILIGLMILQQVCSAYKFCPSNASGI